jgi:hypothetical protein
LRANLGDTPDRTYSAVLTDLTAMVTSMFWSATMSPTKLVISMMEKRTSAFRELGRSQVADKKCSCSDLNGDHKPDIIAANRGAQLRVPE